MTVYTITKYDGSKHSELVYAGDDLAAAEAEVVRQLGEDGNNILFFTDWENGVKTKEFVIPFKVENRRPR